MKEPIALSPEEMRTLVAILAGSSDSSVQGHSWNDLLRRWESFVSSVEKGYQDNFQQYMKDISVRNGIEEVLRQAPELLSLKLAAMLRPLDERFQATTRDLKQPLSAGMTKWASPWWARIPRKVVGELESDLRAEGILKD